MFAVSWSFDARFLLGISSSDNSVLVFVFERLNAHGNLLNNFKSVVLNPSVLFAGHRKITEIRSNAAEWGV